MKNRQIQLCKFHIVSTSIRKNKSFHKLIQNGPPPEEQAFSCWDIGAGDGTSWKWWENDLSCCLPSWLSPRVLRDKLETCGASMSSIAESYNWPNKDAQKEPRPRAHSGRTELRGTTVPGSIALHSRRLCWCLCLPPFPSAFPRSLLRTKECKFSMFQNVPWRAGWTWAKVPMSALSPTCVRLLP